MGCSPPGGGCCAPTQAGPDPTGCGFPQNTWRKFLWKAPAPHAQSCSCSKRPAVLTSLPAHARPRPAPSQQLSPMLCNRRRLQPYCGTAPMPQTLPLAGREPLCQPRAPDSRSRAAEPILREPVPGLPGLPGAAALHHLAAAARGGPEHHSGAVWQRSGRSSCSPLLRAHCQPRSHRFVPQERNVSGKWQFQCQHGSEECLGNMLQVSRATPGPVLTARFGGRSP